MDVSKIYIDCFNDLSTNKKMSLSSLLKKLEKVAQSGKSAEEALRTVFSSGQESLMNYVCRNIKVSDEDDAEVVLNFILDFTNKTFYNVYLSYDTEDGDKYDIDDPVNREFEVTDENVESYMQNLDMQHKNNKLKYYYGISKKDFLVIEARPISGPLKNEEDAVLTLESYPVENNHTKKFRTREMKSNNTWENNNTLLKESMFDSDEEKYYTTCLGYGGNQHTEWAMKYLKQMNKWDRRDMIPVKEDDYTIRIYVEGDKNLLEFGADLANETEADTAYPLWDECSEDEYYDALSGFEPIR